MKSLNFFATQQVQLDEVRRASLSTVQSSADFQLWHRSRNRLSSRHCHNLPPVVTYSLNYGVILSNLSCIEAISELSYWHRYIIRALKTPVDRLTPNISLPLFTSLARATLNRNEAGFSRKTVIVLPQQASAGQIHKPNAPLTKWVHYSTIPKQAAF